MRLRRVGLVVFLYAVALLLSCIATRVTARQVITCFAFETPIMMAFLVFPSKTLSQFKLKTKKTSKYCPTIMLAWALSSLSLCCSTNLAYYLFELFLPSLAWLPQYLGPAVAADLFVQFVMYSRLRPSPLFVSVPCLFFFSWLAFSPPFIVWTFFLPTVSHPVLSVLLLVAPFGLAFLGLLQTMVTSYPPGTRWSKWTERYVFMSDHSMTDRLVRLPFPKKPSTAYLQDVSPLRIVQLTDTHLGPVTTVHKLNAICRSIVDEVKPDMVFITGDLLTTECYHSADSAIEEALEPLKEMEGRVFACLGNHDHEALDEVTKALKAVGAVLLNDDCATVKAGGYDVQVIGINYRSPVVASTPFDIEGVCRKFPPASDIRIILLHDPSQFQAIPVEYNALVLSGHTHGGMVGIPGGLTVVNLAHIPESGLWGNGQNKLYVHRGQGSRSLLGNVLVRLGPSAEYTVMNVFPLPTIPPSPAVQYQSDFTKVSLQLKDKL